MTQNPLQGFLDNGGISSLFFFFRSIGGPAPPASSGFRGKLPSQAYTLGGQENITVEVNNVMVSRQIHNVFGVIKGFADPGRVHLEDGIQS